MLIESIVFAVVFVAFVGGIVMILKSSNSYYEDACSYKSSIEMMNMLHENTKDMREKSIQVSTWKWPADSSVYNPPKTVDVYIPPKSKRFAKKVRRNKRK